MTEISETEIKSMTKEQNYMRGYADGKSDVLEKIKADLEKLANDEWNTKVGSVSQGLECALEIIDKYKAESEE